jgi:hypothetical protein
MTHYGRDGNMGHFRADLLLCLFALPVSPPAASARTCGAAWA